MPCVCSITFPTKSNALQMVLLTSDHHAGKPLPEPKPNTFADVLGSIPADYKKVMTGHILLPGALTPVTYRLA